MIDKDFLFFDLDGTLTDPMVGITKSVRYALKHFNIEVESLHQLTKFIGPPLKDAFMEYYGFSESDALICVEKYRERFKEKGIFENKIYDGIEQLLLLLKENNKKIYLATSKPEVFAEKILNYFNITKYFDFVGGATFDLTRDKKTDVINYVLKENNIKQRNKVVMIGDRKYDIMAAKYCGISSIGVLYGYGNIEEITQCSPDYIVKDVNELKLLLI